MREILYIFGRAQNKREGDRKQMKRFHVKTPDQLREFEPYIKTGNVERIASVWNAKLRKDGKSPWDNAIYAVFAQAGRSRKASIMRSGTDGNMLVVAELKYNPALEWCRENLKRSEE